MTTSLATKQQKKVKRRSKAKIIFIIVMLAYPLVRFGVTWLYINPSTVLSSFMRYDPGNNELRFFQHDILVNYRLLWNEIRTDAVRRRMIVNSFIYLPVTVLISLPLSALFSYFLCKKMPLQNTFRVIFYLPTIIPIAVLTLTFRFSFDDLGFMNEFLRNIGIDPPAGGYFGPNTAQLMIFVYCVWAGLGFNIVLISGAMSRLPQDVLEYGKIEGVGLFREFSQIFIPMIWPTIVTLFMIGMTAPLTIFLQPYFLMDSSTAGQFNTGTISLHIFGGFNNLEVLPRLTAFGLFFSVIYVPIVLLTRKFMNRFFSEVDY